MRAAATALLLALTGCGESPRDAQGYAADADAARRTVEACEAGARRNDCEAAREGLAEARRRQRMAAYEQSV